VEQIATL